MMNNHLVLEKIKIIYSMNEEWGGEILYLYDDLIIK